MSSSLNTFRTRPALVPQSQPVDERQEQNNAGGYTFTVSPLERIKRFLILGSESSFYQSGAALTRENAQGIVAYVSSASFEEQIALIDLIVDVSVKGRAPKQSPAIFALALVIANSGIDAVKHYGYSQLGGVCRTASTLFEFASYLNQFQRFGMGARKAISRWYAERLADGSLGYQMAKYKQRHGFSHADLLRLSKGAHSDSDLLKWAVGKPYNLGALPKVVQGVIRVHQGDISGSMAVENFGLSWEMLPSEQLKSAPLWSRLVLSDRLPLTALIRTLGRMTAVGALSDPLVVARICARLTDAEYIRKSRVHPMNILVAMKTYAQGRGEKGKLSWQPVSRVSQALDQAFYLAFPNVEPTGKRHLLALDVSGSMAWGGTAGTPLTAREAVTGLALIIAATEKNTEMIAFQDQIVPLDIAGRRLDDALRATNGLPFGRTDCAQPMLYALKHRLPVDTFVVMTDNETWHGQVHPHIALQQYRQAMGIDAKLVVLSTEATRFSIADPSDPGMLDISGFDLAVPQVLAEFSRGL